MIRNFPPALTLPLALALALPAVAQGDFDLDKTTPGTLGSSQDLAYNGTTANTLAVIMASFTGGPTALSAVDPADPRSVLVGTELSAAWIFTLTGAGSGNYSLALPNLASLDDLVFHWQMLTLPVSGPTIVGEISNDVVTQTSLPATGLLARDSLLNARAFSAGFFDRDNNAGAGDFIVAGGGSGTLTSAVGLATTEVWDFRRMAVRPGNAMTTARALHLPVRLDDGRVLLIGGADSTGSVLDSCEIYDPATDTYSATGAMNTPRILHAATRLPDGRVMVTGGTSTLADVLSAITNTLRSTEIYDPATGQWSGGPAIGGNRLAPALTTLSNGLVMVSGGVEVGFFFGIPVSAMSTTSVQLYNPGSNSWTNGPSMSQGRAGHHYNQVTLGDDRVLMSGGIFVPSITGAANSAPISGAEVYTPGGTWSAVNMSTARGLHSASLLPNGNVAVCGGAQGTLTAPTSIADVEIFDPTTNTWAAAPALTAPRSGHAASVMPDGTLILFGGQDATTTTPTIETLRF